MKKTTLIAVIPSGVQAAALIYLAETRFEDYLQATCFHYHLTRQPMEA